MRGVHCLAAPTPCGLRPDVWESLARYLLHGCDAWCSSCERGGETHRTDCLCTCSRSPRRRKESAAHKASRAAAAAAEAVAQAAAATAEAKAVAAGSVHKREKRRGKKAERENNQQSKEKSEEICRGDRQAQGFHHEGMASLMPFSVGLEKECAIWAVAADDGAAFNFVLAFDVGSRDGGRNPHC